jgi:SAM-dependent methyltransferase
MEASVGSLFTEFESMAPAASHGIAERTGRNPFLWRGQFPPELVASLLDSWAGPGSAVLDPFVGSGTVLLESARKGLACIGTEINPAAMEMARTYLFCNADDATRKRCIAEARDLLHGAGEGSLSSRALGENGYARISMALRKCEGEPLVRNIIANALMRTGLKRSGSVGDLEIALENHAEIISGLPHSGAECKVVRADARRLPVGDGSIDLIVTSPPYLNVFEYSQNYGRSAELLRWKPGEAAAHEIGTADKGNPFLSVIRYALDMRLALIEMRRVLKDGGRAIIVIGRESRINGIPFANSALVYTLAASGCGLGMALRQSRSFATPDGSDVTEDILHLVPRGEADRDDAIARDSAKLMLKRTLADFRGAERERIRAALKEVRTLGATPVLGPAA